jgi:hypothetical protein
MLRRIQLLIVQYRIKNLNILDSLGLVKSVCLESFQNLEEYLIVVIFTKFLSLFQLLHMSLVVELSE